ncbi:hypothetical protein E2C01_051238 [Portunus trituberculatus]|uniref:Uncharacterized protein n=1 Tax=Portunus trituberculatus TaxID=210409 RepID=A0A5B7GAF5_PORTR|nr:hypothetical protein [Portunus trituberculatus]
MYLGGDMGPNMGTTMNKTACATNGWKLNSASHTLQVYLQAAPSPCHALIHKDTLWGRHNLAITSKSISRSKYNPLEALPTYVCSTELTHFNVPTN